MITPYRGRLAPTPTGLLHVGHAATFYHAWRRAREVNGSLVLRIEDLDPHRCKTEFADSCQEDLLWLGIDWDEGPFFQRDRREFFLRAWKHLRDQGLIYPCHRSRRDVETCPLAPHCEDRIFPATWRGNPKISVRFASPEGVNWRFRVPDGEQLSFLDTRLGLMTKTAGTDFGDFLVWNRADVPAYELAVVVDDAAMRITEVVRGEDLVMSTFRQLLLYRALEIPPPSFCHTPLILDASGRRLSKRSDSLSLAACRHQGLQPKDIFALINSNPERVLPNGFPPFA